MNSLVQIRDTKYAQVFFALVVFALAGCGGGGGGSSGGFVAVPANFKAVPGDGQVVLTWSQFGNIDSYDIYWSTSLDLNKSNGTLIANVNSGFIHTGLNNAIPYFYIAVGKKGSSESVATIIDRATPSPSILLSSLVFADVKLAECVNDTATSNSYTLLYELTDLDCSNGIKDLTGIEALTSLERLILINNEITNIQPLANLISLDFIFIPGCCALNNISDLAPLGGLVYLRTLNLDSYFKSFLNTSSLENLTHLEDLSLAFNNISDISFLANMPKLEGLDLSGSSSLSGHSIIYTLSNLEFLGLGATNLTDISQLPSLKKLKSLNISDNPISDFSPLSSLSGQSEFTSLDLGGTGLNDLALLSNFTNLTDLDISSNLVISIAELAGLTKLITLDMNDNNISDISVLSGMSDLHFLNLGDNNITNFSALSALSGLSTFEASNSNLGSISFLSNNTFLSTLRLNGNNLISVSEFTGFNELRLLVLDDNNLGGQGIGNVDQLSTLPVLQRVQISNNINMSCIELASLITSIGSPPVDTDMNSFSIDVATNGVNCTDP